VLYDVAVKLVLVALVCACGGSKPAPAPPVPLSNETRGCADAAAGIERGTRGIREPEASILAPMRARCHDDTWPPAAIDCFAEMTEDELGKCAGKLDDKKRERMFAALGGNYQDRTAVAVAVARLANLKVGVPECDHFVTTVATVLGCEQMPIETRLQLGNETADFWSLPTDHLSADAQHRMATVCGQSLGALQQRAAEAGCKL
jgi:hypothetical protein